MRFRNRCWNGACASATDVMRVAVAMLLSMRASGLFGQRPAEYLDVQLEIQAKTAGIEIDEPT